MKLRTAYRQENTYIFFQPFSFIMQMYRGASELFLPELISWIRKQEKRILATGIELTPDQKIDAYQVGVKEIERIRVNAEEAFPSPDMVETEVLGKRMGMFSSKAKVMAFGHGLFLNKNFSASREAVLYQMVRIMQCERLGGIEEYIRQYFHECTYHDPHERLLANEAVRIAQELVH